MMADTQTAEQPLAQTLTGAFPVGFRRGWSDWQRDLDALVDWAKQAGFACLDLGNDADQLVERVVDAGLKIGSVDLPDWRGMICADADRRKQAVEANARYIEVTAAHGVRNYFVVMLPEDPSLEARQNADFMYQSFAELAPALETAHSHLVIEGWPGPGALCVNPEGLRALFREVDSTSMGINYDPSHLIRLGIDPIRFLQEFRERVYHAHAKDTELYPEALYEIGHGIEAIEHKAHGFGECTWRYTLPGHGCMRWKEAFAMLEAGGYQGAISIELEDEHFNTGEEGEKQGLKLSRDFLAGC